MARHRQKPADDEVQDQEDKVQKAVRDIVARNENVRIDPHQGNRPGKHEGK